ncbi:MAG: restriction endonuclease subunit S, partial [Oscillospiraceae bacterium]|nr:restriction endonuclease subunit S [Oscillospiraceae bacterium]
IEGAKATIAHLPGAKLKSLVVVVPPLALQNEFAAFVSQIDKSKSVIPRGMDKLEILKFALTQEYFE